MLVADFDYELPPELIAQQPADERNAARMLVVERKTGECAIRQFADFPTYLRSGDCLVINDTRVMPARLFGRKQPSGGRVELLLLEEIRPGSWQALIKPGKRVPLGCSVSIVGEEFVSAVVQERRSDGVCVVQFSTVDVRGLIDRCGRMPLPPYIQRDALPIDRERYQTVFAAVDGAVAAPTAGLHFDASTLSKLEDMGVTITPVTLHVGLGTFRPVSAFRIEDHRMHEEQFELTTASAARINETRRNGGRIVAVGTTAVRVLESCAGPDGTVTPRRGKTGIFLHPPYCPRCADSLLTNFHLPKSTLLMLVCTFARREDVLNAYRLAIHERFRFYSYGDCMFFNP